MYVSLSETWERLSPSGTFATVASAGSVDPPASRSNTSSPFSDPASIGGAPTKIRGTFGSQDSRGQFEISSAIPTQNTPSAFSAGFAFIAALFPTSGETESVVNATKRMETGVSSSSNVRDTGTTAPTAMRGGYASLPTDSIGLEEDGKSDASVWGTPPQSSRPHHTPTFTSARTHQWGPPTVVHSSSNPYHQHRPNQDRHSQQYHQHQQYIQNQHNHYPRQEPTISQNFAKAFSAINSLTQNLSNSVFGGARSAGPTASQRQQEGGYRPGAGNPYVHPDGADTSLMSVQLEESFSV